MNLIYPLAVQWMVDAISGEQGWLDFDTAALLLLAMFLVQSVFSMLRAWLFTMAGERVVARLRTDVYRAILDQDTAFFDRSRTGELTSRLSSDTTVLQNTVTVNVSMGLRFGVGAIGGATMLLIQSPTLTGVAMLVVPVVAIGAALYGRLIRRVSTEVQDALAHSTEVAEESIAGMRTVRSFAREGAEVARYGAAVQESYRLAAKRALLMGIFNGVTGFAGYGALGLVVWYGGRMVSSGEMTIGQLTAFLLYTLTVAFSIGALSSLWADFMRALGASERVFALIDRQPDLEGTGAAKLERVEGHVRFVGVRFRYPTPARHPRAAGARPRSRAGRGRRPGRPLGIGQVDHRRADRAVLRPGRRRGLPRRGPICAPSTRAGCASRSARSARSPSSSPPASRTTSATAAPTPPTTRSAQRSKPRTR